LACHAGGRGVESRRSGWRRVAAGPHTARRRPAADEAVVVEDVWKELERRGASIAEVPFSGQRGTGLRFGTVVLGQIENGEAQILKRWPGGGDALVGALKAPVVGRFGGFAGLQRTGGTLTWSVAERTLASAGRRGEESFEEVLGLLR